MESKVTQDLLEIRGQKEKRVILDWWVKREIMDSSERRVCRESLDPPDLRELRGQRETPDLVARLETQDLKVKRE